MSGRVRYTQNEGAVLGRIYSLSDEEPWHWFDIALWDVKYSLPYPLLCGGLHALEHPHSLFGEDGGPSFFHHIRFIYRVLAKYQTVSR